MASYKEAVEWIAHNDSAGDTPEGLDLKKAFDRVSGIVSVVMVADLWKRPERRVVGDVLKVRGFVIPRGFLLRD